MLESHSSHVTLWLKARREIFKEAAWIGDLVRECFPNARVSYAEENGRKTGKPVDTTKAVTWR